MTIFESKVLVGKPVAQVYNFLSDLNNHKLLMPDEVEDWMSTADTAAFTIRNMARINLAVDTRTQNLNVTISAVDKPPFQLQLMWNLTDDGQRTDVVYTISAELNMMLKMLASASLQKLADMETQRLADIFN